MAGLKEYLFFDLRRRTLIIGTLGVIDACMKVLYSLNTLYVLHSRELACSGHCVVTPYVFVVACFLFLGAFHLLASSLLLHGVLKSQPSFMYPYRFEVMFNVILGLSVAAHELAQQTYPARWFGVAAPLLLGATIYIYFYLVVRSYQFQLQQRVQGFSHVRLEEEEPQIETANSP